MTGLVLRPLLGLSVLLAALMIFVSVREAAESDPLAESGLQSSAERVESDPVLESDFQPRGERVESDPAMEPGLRSSAERVEREDVWLRPFQSTSIWNMPVGSAAQYEPATLPFTERNLLTNAYLLALDANDPEVDLIQPGTWRDRCSGTERSEYTLNLPDGYVVEPPTRGSNGAWRTPNNGFAFLLPDGRTIINGGQGARCSLDGPIFGHTTGVTETDLYGDGRGGGHGASHLSVLGGAIRPGELESTEPIPHVLDIAVYSRYLYSDGKQTKASTFRWPATSSDSYALDPNKADRYVGDLPELRIGSLLALPPDVTADDLEVRSPVGQKLFAALRDYGAYVTEDSAWEANLLLVDEQAKDEFEWGDEERREFGRMVAALHVITNNGPDSIGGGGEPRRPLLPPLPEPPGMTEQSADRSLEPTSSMAGAAT